LLVFRCAPIITPYLEDDYGAGVLIDTYLTYSRHSGAQPLTITQPIGSEQLGVSISFNGAVLATAVVPFNSTKLEINFPLANLSSQPRKDPFTIDCTATYSSQPNAESTQTFRATTSLFYLKAPPSGSVTKRDARTGALMVKAGEGKYETIFPMGFYTSFDNYLASDLRLLDDLKSQGYVASNLCIIK
jgi:hypothetical protein